MTDVVIARWPQDRDGVAESLHAGVAVLYLVTVDDDPPDVTSCLEDWVRMPGDERDLRARLETLERRASQHRAPPFVDDAGLLHFQGRSVHLSATEARLATVLADRFDDVVVDRELVANTFGGEPGGSSLLRVEVAHLRGRLRPMNLAIQRVRRRGYKLRGD